MWSTAAAAAVAVAAALLALHARYGGGGNDGDDDVRTWHASQVVLALGRREDEMVIRFTIMNEDAEAACSEPPLAAAFHVQAGAADGAAVQVTGEHVGCVASDGGAAWHFYVAVLDDLLPGETYGYSVRDRRAGKTLFSSSFIALPVPAADVTVLAMGDTGAAGRRLVLEAAARDTERAVAVIHVGDMSYASNSGECWSLAAMAAPECQWNCARDDETCHGRRRHSASAFDSWSKFFEEFEPVSSRLPIITSMGNHDNDLVWFFKFRPPHASSWPGVKSLDDLGPRFAERVRLFQGDYKGRPAVEQQALLTELLAEPIFFSVDVGPFHVISLQSEDNGINAYERAVSTSLRPEQVGRFEAHFGAKSPQFTWLQTDLAEVDRSARPWVVVLTHRPPIHTSRHHKSCGPDGDWYLCKFLDTYWPALCEHGVSAVLSGHSHHYARTTPLRISSNPGGRVAVASSGPVLLIVGTGGFELSKGFDNRPDWIAFRSDKHHGLGALHAAGRSLLRWAFLDASSSAVDRATIAKNANAQQPK